MKKITLLLLLITLAVPMQVYAATPIIQNGVTIGGIDVSGMNDMEAAEAVNNKVNSDISSEIIIHCVEGKIATLPVKDINLKWKNTGVATEAVSYGNKGNFVKRYKERKDIARNGLHLPLKYGFDRDKLSEFVDNNCMIYNEEAIEATITRTEEGFTITPGTTGVIIDKQEAMDFITNYIENEWNGDNAEIDLPCITDEPEAGEEELSQVTDILGSFETSYKTSGSNRSANVANGCRLVNGTLLRPGEEFSMYDHIKPFSEENGYKMAGSYMNGMVVDSLGGGICQVSTTLYNAVLRAELEVTERNNHSMIVNYVPASADAAISESAGKDFRFVNNTEYPIYIEGYTTDDKKIVFNIYGKETRPDNRVVEYKSEVLETTPALTENIIPSASYPVGYISIQSAHTGYKARLLKIVTVDGIEESREVVNSSSYKMVPRTAVVGIATTDPNAAAQISESIATGSIDYCAGVAGAWAAAAAALNAPATNVNP